MSHWLQPGAEDDGDGKVAGAGVAVAGAAAAAADAIRSRRWDMDAVDDVTRDRMPSSAPGADAVFAVAVAEAVGGAAAAAAAAAATLRGSTPGIEQDD